MTAPDTAVQASAVLLGEAVDRLADERDAACRALADIALAVANLRDQIAADPGMPAALAVDRIANFLPLSSAGVPDEPSARLAYATAAAWLAAELDLLPAPDRDVLEDTALGLAANDPERVTDAVVAQAARTVPCLLAALKRHLKAGAGRVPVLVDHRTGDPGQ